VCICAGAVVHAVVLPRHHRQEEIDRETETGKGSSVQATADRVSILKFSSVQMVSKGRLYIGLGQKYWIKDDSDSCSVRFVPGALEASGFASGSSCVISDYEQVSGDGIFPCTAETRLSGALELVRCHI